MRSDSFPIGTQDKQTLSTEALTEGRAGAVDWRALYLEEKRAREQAEAQTQHLNDVLAALRDGLVLQDGTKLKATEISQQRLAAIVESSDDAIIGKTLDGIITDWNPAAERMFGYTAEETFGKPMTLLFPPDRLEEEKGILERLRQGI